MSEPQVETAEHPAVVAPLPLRLRVGLWPRSAGRRAALRDTLAAFAYSRLLVWLSGIVTVLAFGFFAAKTGRYDPTHMTMPFHTVGNVLVSPAARWDSSWYLGIAKYGYVAPGQSAFFPLFPVLMGIGGPLVGSDLLFGIFLSSACSVGGLYLLHRLVALDVDAEAARATVWIVAWLPPALFLSAVYTEGLFLLLTVGAFYSGRLGRWPLAATCGALAAATRSSGVLLLVPLAILYLYGPRADRAPDNPDGGRRPRYRLRPDAGWLGAVPLGLGGYLGYLAIATGNPAGAFSAQHDWHRVLMPLGGIPLGIWKALGALWRLATSIPTLELEDITINGPGRAVVELAVLVIALWLLRECWRRLPAAYTAYAAVALALPLSVPSLGEPLRSLPRFTLVLFPLWIALALWARERGQMRAVITICAPLLAVWTVMFTAWIWAA